MDTHSGKLTCPSACQFSGTSKPSTSSSHLLITLYFMLGVPGRTQVVDDLGLQFPWSTSSISHILQGQTHQAPEPCWSKSCAMVSASEQHIHHSSHGQASQPTGLEINHSRWRVNSNQGPTTTGGCTQHKQGWGVHLKHPAQLRRLCHWALQDTYKIERYSSSS